MSFDKNAVVQKYASGPADTGSARVQVALLTERINSLTGHFKDHPKDHHSRQGLLAMVSRRRRLLTFMRRTDVSGYRQLIDELGLRH